MSPEDFLGCPEKEVGRGVVAHQGPASLLVDDPLDPVAPFQHPSTDQVEDHVPYLC